MPIRPENRARYPKNWREIRARILERAGHRCELCGVKNYALGAWVDGHWHGAIPEERMLRLVYPRPGETSAVQRVVTGKVFGAVARIVRVVLTIAHWDNPDPADCRDENLKAACQRCHNLHDMPMRRRNAAKTRRAGKAMGDLLENV